MYASKHHVVGVTHTHTHTHTHISLLIMIVFTHALVYTHTQPCQASLDVGTRALQDVVNGVTALIYIQVHACKSQCALHVLHPGERGDRVQWLPPSPSPPPPLPHPLPTATRALTALYPPGQGEHGEPRGNWAGG